MSSGGANISSYADNILFYIPRVPYTGISITDASGAAYQSGDEINLNVGDTMTLTAVLEPAATNDKVVWKTGNNQVATVNESSGVITAVGCGSTTVTAQVYDDAYTITVNVSGPPYIDPYLLPTNNWVLAASWEDLTNAAFVGRSNANTWRSRNSNKMIGGIPVRSAKLVYAYDSVSKVAYFLSGTVTEETFNSTTKYYYIPQPATSFTYHPAEPATCSQHATIGYWTDQDGYKFLDANGQTPIDSIYDETSPFGEHVWGELAVTREPTCCEAGEGKHTCTKCGTIETVSVDPDSTKHSLTHHDAVPATCTGVGTKEHWECSLCNKRFRDDAGTQELINLTVNALGHDWGNDTWIWATDYSSASVTLTCGRCGAEKTLTDNELHIVTVVSEPTCTENKVVRYAAEVQDDENDSIFYGSTSSDVEVPDTSLGHDWGEWFTTTPATCSAPGEKTRTCKNDPSHTETEEIPALTHNWYAWTAVEGYPGLQEHDCANCGEHETRIHPFLQFVVAAGDGQTYTKGSQNPLAIKFDKKDIPDLRNVNVYQMFRNGGTIEVTDANGNVTTLGAGDFSASEGSLDVTLSTEYLEGLEEGNYAMTVTFVVAPDYLMTGAPASFTVSSPAPAGSDSPATGESAATPATTVALMMLAAYGVVYATRRRRAVSAKAAQ